jgi:hypothetical protein
MILALHIREYRKFGLDFYNGPETFTGPLKKIYEKQIKDHFSCREIVLIIRYYYFYIRKFRINMF